MNSLNVFPPRRMSPGGRKATASISLCCCARCLLELAMMRIVSMVLLLRKSPPKIKLLWNVNSFNPSWKNKTMAPSWNKPKRKTQYSRKKSRKVSSTKKSSKTKKDSKMNSPARPWPSTMTNLTNWLQTCFWAKEYTVGCYWSEESEEYCKTSSSSHQQEKFTTQRTPHTF